MRHKRCTHHGTPGRSLHLIDIENLVGGSGASADDVAQAVAAYRRTISFRPDDHVVIASGKDLLFSAGLAWPGARLLLASGIDGADLALLDVAQPITAVVAGYDRVVIGSGDGIFAGLAMALRAVGMVVCVLSRPESLATGLRLNAALVRPLQLEAAAS